MRPPSKPHAPSVLAAGIVLILLAGIITGTVLIISIIV